MLPVLCSVNCKGSQVNVIHVWKLIIICNKQIVCTNTCWIYSHKHLRNHFNRKLQLSNINSFRKNLIGYISMALEVFVPKAKCHISHRMVWSCVFVLCRYTVLRDTYYIGVSMVLELSPWRDTVLTHIT